MLLDPRPVDACDDATGRTQWRPTGAAAASRRSSHGFLNLPGVHADVPARGALRYRDTVSLADVARAHFEAGALSARDVRTPQSAAQAFAQAFFAWMGRRSHGRRRLSVDFSLMDANAVIEATSHQYEHDRETFDAPLYLAVELSNECVWAVGERAQAIREAHPRLMRALFRLIGEAGARTVWVRTPDEFLGMYAGWYWDGDDHATDAEALASLKDRFDDDEEALALHLPSVIRPILCPADMAGSSYSAVARRYVAAKALGTTAIEAVGRQSPGGIKRLCREMLHLRQLLRQRGTGCLFGDRAHWGNPIYAACSIVPAHDDTIAALLDDHVEHEFQAGEATTFQCFMPLATTPAAISSQYADLALALEIIASLDRVLTILSQ